MKVFIQDILQGDGEKADLYRKFVTFEDEKGRRLCDISLCRIETEDVDSYTINVNCADTPHIAPRASNSFDIHFMDRKTGKYEQ